MPYKKKIISYKTNYFLTTSFVLRSASVRLFAVTAAPNAAQIVVKPTAAAVLTSYADATIEKLHKARRTMTSHIQCIKIFQVHICRCALLQMLHSCCFVPMF